MSAVSAIQPVYANHADHVEAALSALCYYIYDFLGRYARDDGAPLALNRAFGKYARA